MPKQSPVIPAQAPDDQYRIAAVSRLTGIPETTIRMWERRYGVVEPARSAGNGRLYSRADIERLQLLKAAVDAGHAIGTVASLGNESIGQRLEVSPARAVGDQGARDAGVVVCGAAVSQSLSLAWADRNDLRLVQTLDSLPDAQAELRSADVVIVESQTLPAPFLRKLRQLRAHSRAALWIVVYGFASRQALARLDQDGIIALALPADPAHLARLCHLAKALPAQAPTSPERRLLQRAAPRRYGEAFLATTARRFSAVRCECPNHLADLLTKLNAFEQYSLECEHANAADASLHALLNSAAAQCRELLEIALSKVLEHENVPEPVQPAR